MCGRYTLISSQGKIQGAFDIELDGFEWITRLPRYNVAPSQDVLAVVVNSADQRIETIESPQDNARASRNAVLFRRGLIPFWAKGSSIGSRMINARAETVAQKPSFGRASQKRRCPGKCKA